MSLFDSYVPSRALVCPVCSHPLSTWQGKDGPCALFVWREGNPAPIKQDVDDEIASPDRGRFRLPSSFEIYSYDCADHQPIVARCSTIDETWTKTEILPYIPPRS